MSAVTGLYRLQKGGFLIAKRSHVFLIKAIIMNVLVNYYLKLMYQLNFWYFLIRVIFSNCARREII